MPPTTSSLNPRTSRLIGIASIIIVVALAGYAGYIYHWKHSGVAPSAASHIVLSASGTPPHDALMVKDGSLSPVTIPSQGTQDLYAEVLTKTHGYYLISGPALGQSTLYKLDLAHADSGLQQLSTSTSEKTDLSVHEPVGLAAYAARTKGEAPHVIVLDMKTGKETDLGEGDHPAILADGLSVLFERGSALISKEISSGKEYKMADITPGAPFAVDTYTSQFAFYDPVQNKIRTYMIMNSGTLSSLSGSAAPAQAPEALFYVNHELYEAHMVPDTLVVSPVSGGQEERIAAPGFSLDGFILTAL